MVFCYPFRMKITELVIKTVIVLLKYWSYCIKRVNFTVYLQIESLKGNKKYTLHIFSYNIEQGNLILRLFSESTTKKKSQ